MAQNKIKGVKITAHYRVTYSAKTKPEGYDAIIAPTPEPEPDIKSNSATVFGVKVMISKTRKRTPES